MKKVVLLLALCLSCNLASAQFPIDFSRVGYMWGEKPIPDHHVSITLSAPSDGADMTSVIQEALDKVKSPGTVLLKEGQYNVSGTLYMRRSGVVLRGEGNGTVITATSYKRDPLIVLGKDTRRVTGERNRIVDDFTPAGQMWVRVDKPSKFSVGDRVDVVCEVNQKWVSDLKMDQIAQRRDGRKLKQWTPQEFVLRWERHVVKVKDGKIWLDNPIVMELDSQYVTSAYLEHVTWDRVSQCGIENMKLVSRYDPSVKLTMTSGKYEGLVYDGDEKHCWKAIEVRAAEHCWIRNIESAHFAFGLVSVVDGGKNITVRDCIVRDPVSRIFGGRRYAFHISSGQLCLFERCSAGHDRHGHATSSRASGPNVFVDCSMTNAFADMGPHLKWASGLLYDCCTTDGWIAVQDRAGYGNGHGWTAVSCVLWNCEAGTITCQSPWVNGKNWCIGCIARKTSGRRYDDALKRPDGVWESHGEHVAPLSLYRQQLEDRKELITKKVRQGKHF